jgi:hypothetical protein
MTALREVAELRLSSGQIGSTYAHLSGDRILAKALENFENTEFRNLGFPRSI